MEDFGENFHDFDDYQHQSSSVGRLIAQATAGISTDLLDSIRSFAMDRDLYIASWLRCFRSASRMPPTPYDDADEQQRIRRPGANDPALPAGRFHKAAALQECYTGFASKTMAAVFDVIFLWMAFLFLHMIYAYTRDLFVGKAMATFASWMAPHQHVLVLTSMAFGTCWFWYHLLTTWLIGKTVGMHIVGLEIVIDRRSNARADFDWDDGISFWRAFFRTIALPLSLFFLFFAFFRRDGRMLHDLIAGTGVVYRWDADMARYRQDVKLAKQQATMKSRRGRSSGLMAPLLYPNNGYVEP
jgi:uncharacterized RDD family membrane protein YckC